MRDSHGHGCAVRQHAWDLLHQIRGHLTQNKVLSRVCLEASKSLCFSKLALKTVATVPSHRAFCQVFKVGFLLLKYFFQLHLKACFVCNSTFDVRYLRPYSITVLSLGGRWFILFLLVIFNYRRILLQCLESHANRYGRYIQPLLSLSIDFYCRVFVR